METTDYGVVLEETAEACSLDPESISTDEFAALRRFHRKRLRTGWSYWWWPPLCPIEKRYYRAAWDAGTTYAAGDEVMYAPTQSYYIALQGSLNEAPADSEAVTNLTYWAELEPAYPSATEYDSDVNYVAGDQVTYAGEVYQCYSPIRNAPPTDTDYWGLLAEFSRYVAYEQTGKTALGDIKQVWALNPRAQTKNRISMEYELNDLGVQVLTPSVFAWVEFRRRPPVLTGSVWDSTATYTVGEQVYFSTGVPGNFYVCVTNTAAGESPATKAESWSVVELPLDLHAYLVHGGAADWLMGPGADQEAGMAEEAKAMAALEEARAKYFMQGMRERTEVQTR